MAAMEKMRAVLRGVAWRNSAASCVLRCICQRQYAPFTRKPMLKKSTHTALPALPGEMPRDAPALVSAALREMPRLGRLERIPAETPISKPVTRPVGEDVSDELRSRCAAALEQRMRPPMASKVPNR